MIKLYFDTDNANFQKRYSYIVNTLLAISGISAENDISIFCGENPEEKYDAVIGTDALTEAFDIITCREEYNSCSDKLGRFLAEYSNRNNMTTAVINNLAIELKKEIERAAEIKNISLKISERKFTIVLSHDVDNITDKNIYIFLHRIRKGIEIMKNRKIAKGIGCVVYAIKRLFHTENPYWDFEDYMKLEDSYGFKSSFYFINGRKGRYGARYKLDRVKEIIKKIEASGWEAALHTNYFSYNNTLEIIKEKRRMEEITGRQVYGCRNHYLRFRVPNTWQKLKEAGLRYDTTFGYPDKPGFRAGIAFPFYPYDLNEERRIDILEIPLAIMDQTLFERKNDINEVWETVERILEEVRKVDGTIAVNFHTSVSYNEDYPGWKEVYVKILEYIKAAGGRGITARQLARGLM